MNGKGLNCRGWGSYPPLPTPHHHPTLPLSLSYVLEGETKRGAVMPMTAPHSADRDQWLMKGFGSPPDISHSLPPWQLHPSPLALRHCRLCFPENPNRMGLICHAGNLSSDLVSWETKSTNPPMHLSQLSVRLQFLLCRLWKLQLLLIFAVKIEKFHEPPL